MGNTEKAEKILRGFSVKMAYKSDPRNRDRYEFETPEYFIRLIARARIKYVEGEIRLPDDQYELIITEAFCHYDDGWRPVGHGWTIEEKVKWVLDSVSCEQYWRARGSQCFGQMLASILGGLSAHIASHEDEESIIYRRVLAEFHHPKGWDEWVPPLRDLR